MDRKECQKCKYKTINWIRGSIYKRDRTEPAHMVRPCSRNGRRKTAQNSIEVDAKTKERERERERARQIRPKKNWMEGIKKAMSERNLNEGQWEDRKQWALGVGQRRKSFETDIYIYE